MNANRPHAYCTIGILLALAAPARSTDEKSTQATRALRLVPFPKQIELQPGRLLLDSRATLVVSDGPVATQAATDLKDDLARFARIDVVLSSIAPGGERPAYFLCLSRDKVALDRPRAALSSVPDQPEGYALVVTEESMTIGSQTDAGLAHGIQTLRQLILANMKDRSIPGLKIADWPSLRYRGYSDDITRGSSPRLEMLLHEIRTTALLKMNFFSYYMEHQFAFKKHPDIGPKDGSLTPEELKALVEYARPRGVEIIGNQQSFGHFGNILRHDAYMHLRETPDILNPTLEETYKLLDDMYSEEAPLLESRLFNVCCDETDGLGTGPSKTLAEKIGVGGVYVMHIKRIHDLLKDKYGKRMMMWGDIILRHPEHLPKIPKDTIMLSWGYDPRPSFDAAITPFSKSGYEFFVCPGVSCWSRILPDFGVAVTNIRNYVRDGAKNGALGMWNTTWDDDGENFFSTNWHGVAWGAECAWNASTTPYEDFNRRIGAVLFGESDDHFGQAVDLLAKTHRLPNYDAMMDSRFWNIAQDLGQLPVDEPTARKQAKALLDIVNPAIEHLRALKSQAKANACVVDFFTFGAERMRLMATRALEFLDAARAYEQAVLSAADSGKAVSHVQRSEAATRKIRGDHQRLKNQYVELWNRENKPYALDWVTRRFDAVLGRYDKILSGLQAAGEAAKAGKALPSAREMGLEITEMGVRRTRPARVMSEPLQRDIPWMDAAFKKRTGIVFESGSVPRCDQPVEVDLPASANVEKAAKLFELGGKTDSQTPALCQVQTAGDSKRLCFVATGQTPKQGKRLFLLYFDRTDETSAQADARAVRLTDAPKGMKWVENDQLRLLIGPEGAHIYRWEIKALGGRDITPPGESDWAGFADIYGPQRSAVNRIEVLASGPAMVRLKCTGLEGLEKVISVYAGLPWIEVTLNSGQSWFWCYDDIALMGADSPAPATLLFSNGDTGKVKKTAPTSECQERRANVQWGAKFVPGGVLLALITPEAAATHVVGPGDGMGGVGVEGSPPAAHFVIYGGTCPRSPKETLDQLRAGLDYRNQPSVEVYAVQRQ
jgi:hypothetical protein